MSHSSHVELKPEQIELKSDSAWRKLPLIGLVLAGAGLGGAYAMKGDLPYADAKFWTSYLNAYMFTMAICLGGLFFVVIQHITRASWSIVLRRLAEHAMFALPFVALAGIPIMMVGDHSVFEWTHTEVVENDPMLSAKAAYLNEHAANLRFGAYVAIWVVISMCFWGWSMAQDKAKGEDVARLTHKMRSLAPIGVATFAVTLTFGAFDFLMSLDPHWFSTIFGVYYFATSALTIFSFLVIITVLLQRSGYLNGVVTPEHFHDLGKFLFGFTIFWTYIAFSQYFLIWYANIPEETHWFSYRGHGEWLSLSIFLVFGRFVIPWFILLRRPVKRNPSILVWVASWIFVMGFVDAFFLVQPAFAHHQAAAFEKLGDSDTVEFFHHHIYTAPTDALCLVGFIGLFLAAFGFSLGRRALVPVQDPRLNESLTHENF